MSFPLGFVWGAAAASYQVEGAAYDDGRGLSVWDVMCRDAGKIWDGSTGEIACDHYYRSYQDVRLMAQLGLQGYRFSVSWPRVLPEGTGAVNEKGLAFYDQLVDDLLENGIEPWVTLFHWDYPYELFCRGGWLNRASADWFADYTAVVIDRLSDRVSHWITQNEPQVYIGNGHQSGYHAPGLKLAFSDVLLATHHSLLAHGKAVQVIRARCRAKPVIGAALLGIVKVPASEHSQDVQAARVGTFAIRAKDCWNNAWFADPLIFGAYPEDGLELFQDELPEIRDGDMETIGQPLDFYGVNIYQGTLVRAAGGGYEEAKPLDGRPLSALGWPVVPESLYWGPRFFYERYGLPIVVTENGLANCDWVHLDGKVHDPQRIDFITRYLREYRRAIHDGVTALGYFHWSVTDNFNWAHGFRPRFGLIYVDYGTQERIPKDSAAWYSQIIATNGSVLGDVLM